MRPDVTQIKNIVVVMMENRSFDHLLGYLSLNKFSRPEVEGLQDAPDWNAKVASVYQGASFPPWHCNDPFSALPGDPPHERGPIAVQVGDKVNGVYPMNGFVSNYATVSPVLPGDQPPVMSYFTPDEAPVTGFLADSFAICDRWFSSLPGGTQPNRLMAMSGLSHIDVNAFPLPDQPLVYDWLNEREITWRVYHEGMPFFAMMPRWTMSIFDENHFRSLDHLDNDIMEAQPGELPNVIFMEPTYTDAPHVGPSSDDHAPTDIKSGQEFLLQVYKAFSSDLGIWAGTVIIITYDEHGGFFDHVPPVPLVTNPPPGVNYPAFETSGVRVPALIVSPFVQKGTVFHGLLDHTSILKFIGQVFGGGSYSQEVDERQVGSVWDVLNVANPSQTPPPAPPSLDDYLARAVTPVGYTPGKLSHNDIAKSFKAALDRMHNDAPEQMAAKFPELHKKFGPQGGQNQGNP